MAGALPPPPTNDAQGSFAWLEWFRQLRNYISTVGSVPWSIIDFAGSTLSSIASRSHQVLQALQGGTTGEYYHLTSAQHTALTTVVSGVYTPTLTNVANLAASTAYQCQYVRVDSVVTVSGKVDIDPTLAATSTQLGISLPIASNLGANEDCAGTAFASAIAGQGAAILGDAANNRAQLQYISADLTNQSMYFTFQYRII